MFSLWNMAKVRIFFFYYRFIAIDTIFSLTSQKYELPSEAITREERCKDELENACGVRKCVFLVRSVNRHEWWRMVESDGEWQKQTERGTIPLVIEECRLWTDGDRDRRTSEEAPRNYIDCHPLVVRSPLAGRWRTGRCPPSILQSFFNASLFLFLYKFSTIRATIASMDSFRRSAYFLT